MLKKLLVVAVSAAVLAFVSIGAAFIIAGPELRSALDDGHFVWSSDGNTSPQASREFAFDTARQLEIAVPVDLRFVRGQAATMKVTGPKNVLDELVYKDGKLELRKSRVRIGDGLTVTITAPSLAGLRLDAPADVNLTDLDQNAIEIVSSGAADVEAAGRVDTLKLVTNGAADIDFERVQSKDATVEINGAGDIDINATGNVGVEINGAGSVTLHAKATQLKSEINGIGSIDQAY